MRITMLRLFSVLITILGQSFVYAHGSATITYTLIPESQGTRFKREFVYNLPALFGALGDFLSLQSRLQPESAESLRRLKRTLETSAIEGCHEALIRGSG